VRHLDDCVEESWDDPVRGSVRWWELVGGDATETSEITFGIAEVPADGHPLNRGHSHDAAEVYFVLSGEGEVVVSGEARFGDLDSGRRRALRPGGRRCSLEDRLRVRTRPLQRRHLLVSRRRL